MLTLGSTTLETYSYAHSLEYEADSFALKAIEPLRYAFARQKYTWSDSILSGCFQTLQLCADLAGSGIRTSKSSSHPTWRDRLLKLKPQLLEAPSTCDALFQEIYSDLPALLREVNAQPKGRKPTMDWFEILEEAKAMDQIVEYLAKITAEETRKLTKEEVSRARRNKKGS